MPRMPTRTEGAVERGNRVQHSLKDDRVAHVGRRQQRGERNAVGIDHHMALRARL